MNAPFTAAASKVSPTQFLAGVLDHFFAAIPPTRESEQGAAAHRFINAAWASKDIPALRAAYEREKAEIDARWNGDDMSLTYVERIAPGRVAL